VPLRQAAFAIASETVQTWPVILSAGLALAALFGRAWWGTFAAGLGAVLAHAQLALPLGVLSMVVAGGLGAYAWRRVARLRVREPQPSQRARLRVAPRQILVTAPLTLAAVGARVLILPVLALAFGATPPFGQTLLGSFALVHGQLLLPSPAGAGAVDLGVLAQTHGGQGTGALLVLWRVYTTGLGLVLGAATAAATIGRTLLRRRSTRSEHAERGALVHPQTDRLIASASRLVAPQLEGLQDAVRVRAERGVQT
jgi:uncharacterized membrane protein YbhN (UPF0104 family)